VSVESLVVRQKTVQPLPIARPNKAKHIPPKPINICGQPKREKRKGAHGADDDVVENGAGKGEAVGDFFLGAIGVGG